MRIDDATDSTTRIAIENGKLLHATSEKSARQSTRQSEYERGVLTSDIATPSETSRSRDLLTLLKPPVDNGQAGSNSNGWQRTLAGVHRTVLLGAAA